MTSLTTFVLAVALAACTAEAQVAPAPGPAPATRNGYYFLGERWVRGGGQPVHEAISGLGRDGRFSSVMLVVENAPVDIYDVAITFGDGQRFEPGARLTFGPSSTTREIALPGGARRIRRVDFVFANVPGDGRAKVELWGRP